MSAAPIRARAESRSPSAKYDITAADTGSMANISATRVDEECRCAHAMTLNASAVFNTPVSSTAVTTRGLQVTNSG